jgi:hypothetical protein
VPSVMVLASNVAGVTGGDLLVTNSEVVHGGDG